MTWNFRVVRFDPVLPIDETYYGIAEVYYDEQGKPKGYSDPVAVSWDEGEDGPKTLEMMAKAFTLPVLTAEDFGI